MEWQPIETAPKDGTWILVIIAGEHPDGYPYIPACAQWRDGGWFETNDTEPAEDWPLTHWMPLPAPPKVSP